MLENLGVEGVQVSQLGMMQFPGPVLSTAPNKACCLPAETLRDVSDLQQGSRLHFWVEDYL